MSGINYKKMMFSFCLTGWLYEVTGHYPYSFHMGGGMIAASALIMLPIWKTELVPTRHEQEEEVDGMLMHSVKR